MHTHSSFLSLLFRPPPKSSERGPLARLDPADRVCHRCRRRLSAKPVSGRLSIQRLNGEVRITCGRCLARSKPRHTRDEDLFRLKRRELERQYDRLQRLYGR